MGIVQGKILQQFEMGAWLLSIFPIESFAISNTATNAYNEAGESRMTQAVHRSIHILGNQRGGKTSALKSLNGVSFCKEEKPTEGAKIHNARPSCGTTWNLENSSSNFRRQLSAEAIAAVDSGGIGQAMACVMLYFFVLASSVAVNYRFKDMFYTVIFLMIFSFTLLWKNHDMIGRLVISVWAFLFILDNLVILLLLFHEFNLYGWLLTVFGIGSIFGVLLFLNLASGFMICLCAFGIAPGSVLNSDCFTIETSSYAIAAVGIIIGFALGIPFGRIAMFIQDFITQRRLRYFVLLAFTVFLFPLFFYALLKLSWLTLGNIQQEQFENKSIIHVLMVNPTNSFPINLDWFVLWLATGALITTSIMFVKAPARKLLLLPFPGENGTKPCLLGNVRLQTVCFFLGVLLGLLSILAINVLDVFDTCSSIFGINYSSILTASLAFALQASYWPECVRNKLNFNCASRNSDGTADYKILGNLSNSMAKGKLGFEELLQPLFVIADFGGEDFYRALHRVFLKPNGVYLIVFSFKAFDENEKEAYNVHEKQDIIMWIKLAYEYGGRESKAFLVGTHRDSYKNKPEWRRKIVSELYGAVLDCDSLRRGFVYMEDDNPLSVVFQIENDGPREDPALVHLREEIESQFSVCSEKFAEVDNAFYRLEDEVTEMKKNPDYPPIITREQLKLVAKKCGLSDHRLKEALRYLEEFSVIVTSRCRLASEGHCQDWLEKDLYVLIKPQLLSNLIAQLSHQAVKTNCIFSENEIAEIISHHFSSSNLDITLKFLGYHGFLASLSYQRWQLVSCLPADTDESSWRKESDRPCFYVKFWGAQCIYQEIFQCLFARIMKKCDEVPSFEQRLRKQKGMFAFRPKPDFKAIVYNIECHPHHEIFKVTILKGEDHGQHRLMTFLFELLLSIKESHFSHVHFIAGPLCSKREKCLQGRESKCYSSLVGHIFPFRTTYSNSTYYRGEHLEIFCGGKKLEHDSLSEGDIAWLTSFQKRPAEGNAPTLQVGDQV